MRARTHIHSLKHRLRERERGGGGERERGRETDRQTDRQTDSQTEISTLLLLFSSACTDRCRGATQLSVSSKVDDLDKGHPLSSEGV